MPHTIDAVIAELETIKAECRSNSSALGFFALLYCEVTKNVKTAITEGKFEDNPRMEILDVIFAKRYIDAYKAFKNNDPVTESWRIAFEAAEKPLLILQYIFLGINAHINLDLGIAAAETMENKDIAGIKNDFDAINDLLGSMIDDFQDRLNALSPIFKWIDRVAGNKEEMFMGFSINIARKGAWKFTKDYHESLNKPELTTVRDKKVAGIGGLLSTIKSKWVAFVIKVVHFFEEKDVQKIMDRLEG